MTKGNSISTTLMMASVLVTAGAWLSACGPSGNSPNVELMQDMMEQQAVQAQRADDFFEDKIGARVPPSNTQPVGFKPYRYAKDIDAAVKENKNPYEGQMADEILLAGQNHYNTQCAVCHGPQADGNGPLKPKYPLPIPSLLSEKVRTWKDANIYHVITMGQGTMGPYASHIPQAYRWQVVNYIHHLQAKAQGK